MYKDEILRKSDIITEEQEKEIFEYFLNKLPETSDNTELVFDTTQNDRFPKLLKRMISRVEEKFSIRKGKINFCRVLKTDMKKDTDFYNYDDDYSSSIFITSIQEHCNVCFINNGKLLCRYFPQRSCSKISGKLKEKYHHFVMKSATVVDDSRKANKIGDDHMSFTIIMASKNT